MNPLRNIAILTTSLCLSLALLVFSGCGITAISQQREAVAQAQAAQQRYEEQMRLLEDVQRLQRLGRFDEARQRAAELQQSMPIPWTMPRMRRTY